MSAFHQQFTRDEAFPDWYHWSTPRPIFKTSSVRYSLWCDGQCYVEEADDKQSIAVTAYCENGNGFGSYQENCWTHIQTNLESIERELRRKLWEPCRKNFAEFISAVDPDDDEWQAIKSAVNWKHESSLDHQISLREIAMFDDGFDDVGFCTFDFSVGWDEEHGISILIHRNRVLAASGRSDFTNRGSGMIAHAKCIQGFAFTEGDYRIED